MALPQEKPIPLPPEERQLARFSIFEDFKNSPEVLARIERIMKPCQFEPGTYILQEGALGSHMFLLLRGRVAVLKRTPSGDEYKVADLHDHMNIFFGEGALLDIDARSASIKAITHCECYSIEREDFDKFSHENPELALPVFKRIARAVMSRFRKTNHEFLLIYNALVAEIRGR
jgi:CRP-like cAMP-binding protein